MAVLGKTSTFWKTVKQISVTAIGRESERPVRLLVVGDEGQRDALLLSIEGAGTRAIPAGEESRVAYFPSTDPADGFPESLGPDDIVIDLGGGHTTGAALTNYFSVKELGAFDRLIERLLDVRPDLWLALARRFPGLRKQVSERVVHETSVANAEFAMLNALPGVIPIIAPLLPAAAIGDIFLLTKNQTMMMYRLAAAHGLPLDLRARSRDLGPLLGNAFGWRAIARELIAIVPGGVGLAARGAIAYAGTSALGRALTVLYQTGRQPSRSQLMKFYKDAYAGARRIASERLQVIRGQRPVTKIPANREGPREEIKEETSGPIEE